MVFLEDLLEDLREGVFWPSFVSFVSFVFFVMSALFQRDAIHPPPRTSSPS